MKGEFMTNQQTIQSSLRFTMDPYEVERKLCGEKKIMLQLLRDALTNRSNGGWVNSVDIPRLGGPWRYTDTIMKLRRLGFGIASRPVKGKNYCQYKLA